MRGDEFKRDVPRIALTIGLTRRQAASDLGAGCLPLADWLQLAFQIPRQSEAKAGTGHAEYAERWFCFGMVAETCNPAGCPPRMGTAKAGRKAAA